MGREQKRVASINMTKEGFEAMMTMTKKTGFSRKEVVSRALVSALTNSMSEPVVRFNFVEPLLLVELRKDVVALETAAEGLRRGLFAARWQSRDDDPNQIVNLIREVQALLPKFDQLGGEIAEKHQLLLGLTPADHAELSGILGWIETTRRAASEGAQADQSKRMARYDLIERLVRLAISL
jgi:hypothetical protein